MESRFPIIPHINKYTCTYISPHIVFMKYLLNYFQTYYKQWSNKGAGFAAHSTRKHFTNDVSTFF